MDIGSWRCPTCRAVVEGFTVGDPTLPERIKTHRDAHLKPVVAALDGIGWLGWPSPKAARLAAELLSELKGGA